MSYVDQKSGPSPAGLASALIVQGAIGAAVIMGLSVAAGVVETPVDIDTWDIKKPVPPEPEPIPEPAPQSRSDPQPRDAVEPPITVPDPQFDFDMPSPDIPTTDPIFDRPVFEIPRPKAGDGSAGGSSLPTVTYDPVGAKPRNDPSRWLTDRDYKSSWSRRELTGTAGFTLDIAASGKVTSCRVTRSTGHSELDDATCKLIERRARFEPARGSNGEPVAGTFRSSVRWVLPD